MNKKELKLAKEYIDQDLSEYFVYNIDENYRVALSKLSDELDQRIKGKRKSLRC